MREVFDLESLYEEHAQALYAFLLNFTRDENETRDILQDVFVRLAGNPGLLAEARNQRAFLLKLARNAALDLMRRQGTRRKYHEEFGAEQIWLFDETPNPDETEFRAALSVALGRLPPEQREVVHLKLWEGLTFEQIARTLDLPANTAASRYRYALDKLRARLRPLYEELR